MIANFCEFSPIFGEKNGVLKKQNNDMIQFLQKLAAF
jgi:hypothetical protein